VYFYADFDEFDETAAKKHLRPVVLEAFRQLKLAFEALESWEKEKLHQCIESVAVQCEMKLGKIAQPLRVAVTGRGVSPSIDDTLVLVGRDRVLQRIDKALKFIENRVSPHVA